MSWRNIRLIYAREIRDQLRDRRTLFMIAVLPLLLYPLLGMSVFQLSQFLRKSEPKVVVVGGEELQQAGDLPPLVEDGHFAADLFGDPDSVGWLHLEFAGDTPNDAKAGKGETKSPPENPATGGHDRAQALKRAEDRLKAGDVQVVLVLPENLGKRLYELRSQIKAQASGAGGPPAVKSIDDLGIPKLQLLYNLGKEKSRVAHMQVEHVVQTWKAKIERENLLASKVPASVSRPFDLEPQDVAERQQQEALLWSKILPFVLFIWALTGAFYPAVDLCAGEKERGTLETLLSSPALRIEIVWGKLLTVMTFSTATAVLNLTSLGITARYVISQLSMLPTKEIGEGLNLPPVSAALWLFAALLPMSALFSALCLALASFAQHERRPVLSHAVVAGEHAADDAADVAGHGAELGQ